jgi:hypothetical protein
VFWSLSFKYLIYTGYSLKINHDDINYNIRAASLGKKGTRPCEFALNIRKGWNIGKNS